MLLRSDKIFISISFILLILFFSQISFAWTLGAGIGYRLSRCWGLDLGYRYVDLGQARSKFKAESGYRGSIKKDITSHDIILSARYYF